MEWDPIRKQLLNDLDMLRDKADRIDRHLRAEGEPPPKDWEELATFRGNDEVVEVLDGMTKRHIADIELALERMDSGEWRHCLACGGEISLARLQAAPTVTSCIQCAEARECRGKPA